MTTPPPAAVPVVVVHDSMQAQAAARFVADNNHSLIIMFATQTALVGGPALALAMIPDRPPHQAIFALDCGSDPGAIFRAVEVGWTHVVADTAIALPKNSRTSLWLRQSLISPDRTVIDLEGSKEIAAAMTRTLLSSPRGE